NGANDLERASQRFLTTLSVEHWQNLDQVLQDQVLGPLGGLQRALVSGSELMRTLGDPLINQTAALLGELLPITDVAQAILEQGFVCVAGIQRLLSPCRTAYDELVVTPPASPHARCDICDWVPLDP